MSASYCTVPLYLIRLLLTEFEIFSLDGIASRQWIFIVPSLVIFNFRVLAVEWPTCRFFFVVLKLLHE